MAPAAETTTSRSKVEAAGRLSSMECEPKTLTLDQIKFARANVYPRRPTGHVNGRDRDVVHATTHLARTGTIRIYVQLADVMYTYARRTSTREAALYVMNTKTEEEAIRIFTEGLKPVQMTTVVRKSNSFDSSSDDEVELGGSSSYSAKQQGCSGGCRGSSKGGGARGGGGGGHRGCCCRRRSRSIERDFLHDAAAGLHGREFAAWLHRLFPLE
ncbi:hypothetical protein HU200_019814 [Digitaria exilis]|uniref:Uncharacterized protein n=1 Tax=Digitaria exilis TaxID=1010633 RepID=A0A835KF63_9POAL|nr:hypothetical protein HU200_019814 [Digitaria exilis]